MKELKPNDAQRIIDIACPEWQRLLSKNWGYKIAMRETIQVSAEYYEKMRAACTPEQNNLLDEIFGPYRSVWKEIDGKIILIIEDGYRRIGYYHYRSNKLYSFYHPTINFYGNVVFEQVSQVIDFKTVKILS